MQIFPIFDLSQYNNKKRNYFINNLYMSISYQKIPNLPFYSLTQFTQLQPLSRSKSSIYLYQHNQSQEIFVVKEVPYRQETIPIYQVIVKLYAMESIVRVRGLCKMIVKYPKVAGTGRKMDMQSQLFENRAWKQKKQSGQKESQTTNCEIKVEKTEKEEIKALDKGKQQQWLLVFMQQCQQNMAENIKNRRKQRRYFKCQQVSNFINQTLFLCQTLQKQNISHRDIKPENFLFDKGKFKLCDFENSLYFDPKSTQNKNKDIDLTTVEYTSPQFFRNLRQVKNKIFDPYKLDVYAFGVTILYLCSMGKFDLSERRQYLQENSVFHTNFMKQQRRRYLKNNDEFKSLNTIVKIMLEEDQYKRDTFVTLLMKVKPIMNFRELQINVMDEQAISENSKSEESRRKLTGGQKKVKRRSRWQGVTAMQRKSLKSLLILGFSFLLLLLII